MFNPCNSCGEDHEPEDCTTGFNTNDEVKLDATEIQVGTISATDLMQCEECNGNPCYSHCQKYGTNQTE